MDINKHRWHLLGTNGHSIPRLKEALKGRRCNNAWTFCTLFCPNLAHTTAARGNGVARSRSPSSRCACIFALRGGHAGLWRVLAAARSLRWW